MFSNKVVSSLQKTYDESYLKCSTAVYYESQGNEKEAMQCWKSAAEQIQQNPTCKKQHIYSPKSETERALLESLKELEVQCKERIDLLEALRLSREEGSSVLQQNSTGAAHEEKDTPGAYSDVPERGWIGDGTIPAITYTELSKPPLPSRPSLLSRSSSELAVVGGRPFSTGNIHSIASRRPPSLPPYGRPVPQKKESRSPSPDRRTMRTTLRSGRLDSSSHSSRPTPKKTNKGPGANKAAAIAWGSVGWREALDKGVGTDASNSAPKLPESRGSYEQLQNNSPSYQKQWNSHTRRLVISPESDPKGAVERHSSPESPLRTSEDYNTTGPSPLALGAASSALNALTLQDRRELSIAKRQASTPKGRGASTQSEPFEAASPILGNPRSSINTDSREVLLRRRPVGSEKPPEPNSAKKRVDQQKSEHAAMIDSTSTEEDETRYNRSRRRNKGKEKEPAVIADDEAKSPYNSGDEEDKKVRSDWEKRKKFVLKNLPGGVDEAAAKAIFNEIVVHGDEVHWSDVAGLEIAKNALREAVVYPFLRPDLFMGLREPARGMLLFGPPGTGKTMLARAVATESNSTFFSISASSLTSKYLGESEKLVRALFALAKVMAPSIIFVDEIDSLLSQRSGSGEHEATRRIKTEFLIQWSALQRAAAGRESPGGTKERGDPNRVLVLAATNLPWAIDEAARRRFVRRQYIPLPEAETRTTQLKTLLGQQKHNLTDADIAELVAWTDGFSGSDITALAKDAAMGPLRSLGEALLHMTMDQIRPIELGDFQASLRMIRPSVSKEGLLEYENWARQFGERGG